jgi:HAD superfamily hydrolase (TIGR01509 family)
VTLKALIFDVDGTLAETEEAHREAFNEIFEADGLDWHWSVEDYRILLKTTGGKERMRAYRDAIGADAPTDAQIAEMHQRKTARYAEILASGLLSLRPGVSWLVDAARDAGLKVAVATTTNRPNVDALCQCCWGVDADQVFDVIAAGDEVQAKKPAPDVFLLALERLGMRADQAIAFEDSLNGVRSAQAAGLRVLVTPSAYTDHEDFSDAEWVVPNLRLPSLPSELLNVISPMEAGRRTG